MARGAQTEEEYRELVRIARELEEAAADLRLGVVLRSSETLIGTLRGVNHSRDSGSMALALDDGRIVEIDFFDISNLGLA